MAAYMVALYEATDTLHQRMCLAPYLTGGMVVTIVVDFVTFYYILDNNLINYTVVLAVNTKPTQHAIGRPRQKRLAASDRAYL
jgi:hypothetical protein